MWGGDVGEVNDDIKSTIVGRSFGVADSTSVISELKEV